MQTSAGQRSAVEAKCIIWKEVRESNTVCVWEHFYPMKHRWLSKHILSIETIWGFSLVSIKGPSINECLHRTLSQIPVSVCVDGLLGTVKANKHCTLCTHSGGSVWLVSGVCVCVCMVVVCVWHLCNKPEDKVGVPNRATWKQGHSYKTAATLCLVGIHCQPPPSRYFYRELWSKWGRFYTRFRKSMLGDLWTVARVVLTFARRRLDVHSFISWAVPFACFPGYILSALTHHKCGHCWIFCSVHVFVIQYIYTHMSHSVPNVTVLLIWYRPRKQHTLVGCSFLQQFLDEAIWDMSVLVRFWEHSLIM